MAAILLTNMADLIKGDPKNDQDNPFDTLLLTPIPSTPALGLTRLYSQRAFNILLSLNLLSIACSLGCIILLACLKYQKGRMYKLRAQHVSIRLILYAALIDLGYSGFRIYDMIISQSETQPSSQANCQAAMFGVTFFSLLSVFIRALFSIHLHVVIVHRVKRPLSYENRFLMFCFVLSLVLALLPLTRLSYAWIDFDPTLGSGHCSYFSLESVSWHMSKLDFNADNARRAVVVGLLYCWITYFGWVALTIGYSLLVVGAVIYRLWMEQQQTMQLIEQRNKILLSNATTCKTTNLTVDNLMSGGCESAEHSTPMLVFVRHSEGTEIWHVAKKVLRRVVQFPTTIIICHSLEVAWATATLSQIIPIFKTGITGSAGALKHLYVAMQVMLAMQGVITLLSFFWSRLSRRWLLSGGGFGIAVVIKIKIILPKVTRNQFYKRYLTWHQQ